MEPKHAWHTLCGTDWCFGTTSRKGMTQKRDLKAASLAVFIGYPLIAKI
jgi:hypothetical protein